MKMNSRRYRRHRNPETPEKKETPFFTRSAEAVQTKKDAFFQPKLAVGQPGDKFEREADNVADQVVNKQPSNANALQRKEISAVQAKGMPEAEKEKEKPLQKKDDPLKKEEEKPVQKKDDPLKKEEEKPIQKKDDPLKKEEEKPIRKKDDPLKKEEEKPIQKKEEMEKREEKGDDVPVMTKRETDGQPAAAHTGLEQRLQQSSGGAALPPQVAGEMSRAIGADFGGVRIHTGEDAAQMNRELGAQAFTHGNDIYFNSGKFDPSSANGKHLLAHELTHVVQQGAAPAAAEKTSAATAHHAAPSVQRETSTPLPGNAEINPKSKIATFLSGNFNVVVLPDRKARKGEYVKPSGAFTSGNIDATVIPKVEKGMVAGVTIKRILNIQTVWAKSANPNADAGYGRGHIKSDRDKGNRSLRFHESCHGEDFIEYVSKHAYPTIEIKAPITIDEYKTRYAEWTAAATEYQEKMNKYTEQHTDEVKDPPAEKAE